MGLFKKFKFTIKRFITKLEKLFLTYPVSILTLQTHIALHLVTIFLTVEVVPVTILAGSSLLKELLLYVNVTSLKEKTNERNELLIQRFVSKKNIHIKYSTVVRFKKMY